MKDKTRVLIVDDSALARELLRKGLSTDREIEVIGSAPDVYVGRDKIVYLKPDVVTLDIEMPRMDGIDFLKRLMPQYPVPVVIVSALAAPGARATLEALEYGAVDFVLKPTSRIGTQLTEMIEDLRKKVKVAAEVDVSRWKNNGHKPSAGSAPKPVSVLTRRTERVLEGTTDKVIAIGASTGGTVALRKMIEGFPRDIPGTVVVQHMPPTFTRMFAERLNDISAVEVREAQPNDRVMTGQVLIAPGGVHLEVHRSGGEYRVRCRNGEKVNGHCPSVEVLFESVAEHVGSNALGVMLTGMGRDGATAMKKMRDAGARTFAQDEATSVVFGMPKEAYACGGAERLVPIDSMTKTIIDALGDLQ